MSIFLPDATTNSSAQPILALDIGSEFVKAVIANPSSNQSLDIIGVGLARQKPGNMHNGAIANIPDTIAVCEQALHDAEQRAGLTCRNAVVGIAGELVKGDTIKVRYRRKNSNKPITDQEMSAIITKIQNRSSVKAREQLISETNNADIEVRLINSAIVAMYIDGYKITNPIGFKGADLAIQFYTAFAPLVHISAIEKVCAELNLDLVTVAVEPFAVCRACMGNDPDSNLTAIVMDVGGGTTDIAISEDGGVEGTRMFGIGGRNFTSRIADRVGIDYALAEKLKIIPERLDLPDSAKRRAKDAIAQNLAVWISGVQLALSDFPLEALPQRILLCGGGASLLELQEALATTDWYSDLPFYRRPIIHLISAEDIPSVRNTTKVKLDHSYITALGLLRVALDTMTSSPEDTGLFARIARLLQN